LLAVLIINAFTHALSLAHVGMLIFKKKNVYSVYDSSINDNDGDA